MKLKPFLIVALACCFNQYLAAQEYYQDPAQVFNKVQIDKHNSNGGYIRIDNYKVTGTPYFMGERHPAILFIKGEGSFNTRLSYNVYKQELEFYTKTNPNTPLIKEWELVDSFILHPSDNSTFVTDIKFLGGTVLGSNEKVFFREMYLGTKYSLYKRYRVELAFVSGAYVKSDLREFDLIGEYYYMDESSKKLIKLKNNFGAVKKEFKNIKDISTATSADEYKKNSDACLRKAFALLNS